MCSVVGSAWFMSKCTPHIHGWELASPALSHPSLPRSSAACSPWQCFDMLDWTSTRAPAHFWFLNTLISRRSVSVLCNFDFTTSQLWRLRQRGTGIHSIAMTSSPLSLHRCLLHLLPFQRKRREACALETGSPPALPTSFSQTVCLPPSPLLPVSCDTWTTADLVNLSHMTQDHMIWENESEVDQQSCSSPMKNKRSSSELKHRGRIFQYAVRGKARCSKKKVMGSSYARDTWKDTEILGDTRKGHPGKNNGSRLIRFFFKPNLLSAYF